MPPRDPQQIQIAAERPGEPGTAWEEIAPGRYMPRRIRGSFRGRALG
jgi:hypothetical protein